MARNGKIPLGIDRIELATGRRESWKKLVPEDSAAVIEFDPAVIALDGESYAYSYLRNYVDDLYVVDGVH